MKGLQSDCPSELMLALALAQGFQIRIDEVVAATKTDDSARRTLMDWAESLTTTNCWWVEYHVRNEVLAQLRAQGISISAQEQRYGREPLPAPKGMMDNAEMFNQEVFTGAWATAKAAEKDDELTAKILGWIAATRRNGSWARRWVAERLYETLQLTWPSTEVTRVIMETDCGRTTTTDIP